MLWISKNKFFASRLPAILTAVLLITFTAGFAGPVVPQARAATAIVAHNGCNNANPSGSSFSCGSTGSIGAGDMVLVLVGFRDINATSANNDIWATTICGQSSTQIGPTSFESNRGVFIAAFYATANSTGSCTAVSTFSAHGTLSYITTEIYDISGQASSNPIDGFQIATGSALTVATSALTLTGNDVIIAGFVTAANSSSTYTAGPGFNLIDDSFGVGGINGSFESQSGATGSIAPSFTGTGSIFWAMISLAIKPVAPGSPSISSFTASPAAIISGNSTTLSWTTASSTSISITPGNFTSTSASGSTTVSPTVTTTYTLTATNNIGSAVGNVTVTVGNGSLPPVISAISSSAISSGSATLSWTTDTNSDSQVLYGTTNSYGSSSALNSALVTNHTVSLSSLAPLTLYHYVVQSRDANGNLAVSADQIFTTVAVAVNPPSISSFGASPSNINSGSSATLSWNISGANTVSIDNGVGSQSSLSSGSVVVRPTQTTTYIITASNTAGTVTAQATVSVTTPPPPPPSGNSIVIYEDDNASRTNLPVTFGRPFVQGEFPQCLQPVIGGTAAASYQVDVKNRWSDGSVKFAVISLLVPSMAASGNAQVSFAASASCNNSGYLTQAQMLNFNNGSWGAEMDVTGSSNTVKTNAATMLAASDPGANNFGDCKNDYYLKGPVVTAVIVQDCTPATSFDFGWKWDGTAMSALATGNSQYASLHPWYILYFYPATNSVRADMVLENSWNTRAQDQLIKVSYLTGAAGSQATNLAYTATPRVLSDVTTTGFSDVITSNSANFTQSDVGSSVSSYYTGDTTICSVQSPTQATLCSPSLATASNQTVYFNDWLWGQMYRKTFWTGSGNPGNYLIDENWPYLIKTGMVAPYDTNVSASPDTPRTEINGCGLNTGSDWSCFSGQVLNNVGFNQTWSDFGDRGGNAGLDESYSQYDGDPTPMSRQSLLLMSNLTTCGITNGACAKAWWMLTGQRGNRDSALPTGVPGGAGIWNNSGNITYHIRESRTTAGSYYCPNMADKNALDSVSTCVGGSGTAFGKPLSKYYDPSTYSIGPVSRPAGTKYTYGHWTPALIRYLEFSYPAWLVTGDYYYAMEQQMNGAYAVSGINGTQADWGSNDFFAYMNPGGATLRQTAGTLDAILKARTVSPDGTSEQQYFDSMLASNAEVQEGIMDIRGTNNTPASINFNCTNYNLNSANRWDWGRCTVASFCGSIEPQGNNCTPIAQALHMPASGATIVGFNANVNARIYTVGYAVAGTTTELVNWDGQSNNPNVGDVLYFSNATGQWSAINGNHTVLAVGTTTNNCGNRYYSTCTTITIDANTMGAAQPLTGALVGHWGSFGQIVNITSAPNAIATANTSPAAYPFEIYGCVDQGSAKNWSLLNGSHRVVSVSNNTFSFSPAIDTSSFPSFNQSGCFYTQIGVKQDQSTDFLQGWMEGLFGISVNEMAGQGVPYFQTIALESNKRLIEKVEDPTYNPYLAGINLLPVKGPSGGKQLDSGTSLNPMFSTWAQVKASLSPGTANANSFWNLNDAVSDVGGNPCGDHAYALIPRAQAAYLPGIVDATSDGTFYGTNAWDWMNTNVPYFTHSAPNGDRSCASFGGSLVDSQIKFAFAPLSTPSAPPPPAQLPTISAFTALPSTITAGSSVTLSWTVSNATSLSIDNGVGSQTSLTSGSVSVSPATTTVYTLTATNSGGSITSQATVTVNSAPDTTIPTASITAPTTGSTVSGTISVSATASDPTVSGQVTSGLNLMSLLVDGNTIATSTTGSLSKSLDTTTLTNASHNLTVTAKDNAGNSFTTPVTTITVNNTQATKYPRLVTLTNLEGLSNIPANTTITATVISPSSGSILETQSNLSAVSGNYTITFQSSDPQLVNIRISVNGYLSALLTNVDTTVNSSAALSVPQLSAGDLNSDNTINSLDYSLMNSHFLQSFSQADINRDGLVNSLDYAILKNNYGKSGQ